MNEVVQDLLIRIERKNMLIASMENFKHDLLSLTVSKENYYKIKHVEEHLYGCSNVISLEDFNLSSEALEGEKNSLLDRIGKSITNVAGELGDIITNALDIFKNLDMSSINYLVDLENKLKSGKVNVKTNEIVNSGINKKLAIYFSMYKDFNTSDFDSFINIPTELFLRQDLIESFVKYGTEYLLEEKSTNVPTLHNTIDIVDNIHIDYIRKWLDKDTKVALINRLTGPTINIMTLTVNRNNEADFRNDHFRIESKYYEDKVINIDNSDLISLIESCVKSSKHFMENMLMIKRLNYDSITDRLGTDAKNFTQKHESNVGRVKRTYRNLNVITNVIRSLQIVDIYMMQSNVELFKVVEKIAKLSLKEPNVKDEEEENL